MTLQEFEEQKDRLVCQSCGAIGLTTYTSLNNGGIRPHCPHCETKIPIPGVQWLAQRTTKTPKRGKVEVADVWNLNGNHCAFCGRSRELCERLGIGLNAQHVVPFYKAGDQWPLIPFCARCHQASTAEQEATRRLEEHDTTLQQIIRRIETKFPELKSNLLND